MNPVASLPSATRVHADGFEQCAVQRRAQRDHHRAAERLGRRELRALQDGAVHAAHLTARRREAASQHHVGNAQLAQRCDRVRCEAKPEAEFTRRRRAFEDADCSTRPAAGRCRPTGRRCRRRRSGRCASPVGRLGASRTRREPRERTPRRSRACHGQQRVRCIHQRAHQRRIR